ncbi:MAG: periplasmic heavy metal sensor [Myxococcales bacterium]|nr:periplasmic heavy metal sensor [Myxococcales bacterium]
MFGFVVGFACLIGFVTVLRRGRRARFSGPWGGCHRARGHHHHHHHRGGRGWRGRGPHAWLYGLFERLDTSPGQEKVIRHALDDVLNEAWGLRGDLRALGDAARSSVAAPSFDESALDAVFAEQDEKLARLRVSAKDALRQIHEALDEEQRAELARLLGGRSLGRFGLGPYR